MAPTKDVTDQKLRLVRPDNPAGALGRAVSYLMTKPAFAKLQFGDWSRIWWGRSTAGTSASWLTEPARCRASWAGRSPARNMPKPGRGPPRPDVRGQPARRLHGGQRVRGEFDAVTRFLIAESRRIARDKTTIYFKRHYNDGKARAARVPINAFVGNHIARNSERLGAASAA